MVCDIVECAKTNVESRLISCHTHMGKTDCWTGGCWGWLLHILLCVHYTCYNTAITTK